MSKSLCLAIIAIVGLTACSAAASTQAENVPIGVGSSVAAEVITPIVAEPTTARLAEAPRSSSATEAPHHASYDAVTCDVRSRRTANGLLIQARASSNRDVSGAYDLVITKSGPSGSSDIRQGGDLILEAGSSEVLGENEISVERGASIRATLTLRNAGGLLCRRSFDL